MNQYNTGTIMEEIITDVNIKSIPKKINPHEITHVRDIADFYRVQDHG